MILTGATCCLVTKSSNYVKLPIALAFLCPATKTFLVQEGLRPLMGRTDSLKSPHAWKAGGDGETEDEAKITSPNQTDN